MARKGTKKDTYWHNIAKVGLSNGLKPAQVGRLIKEVFVPPKDFKDPFMG